MDLALQLLLAKLQTCQRPCLWLIDEQTDINQAKRINNKQGIHCISQRIDQVEQLQQLGFEAELNDYDLSNIKSVLYKTVAFRLGKQKPLIHHLFNQIPNVLAQSGELIIAGAKNEGIKTFSKTLAKLSQSSTRERGKQQNELHVFEGIDWPSDTFDSNHYPELRETINFNGTSLQSKPGIFGWQKIDLGTDLLLNTLPDDLISTNTTILDLGCGYGLIASHAAKHGATVTATDNNLAAVNACQANLKSNGDHHKTVVADCGKGINASFDIVLCNPPFHTGFDVDNNLTQRFINTAAKCLKHSGSAYFVVNQFVPLTRCAEGVFTAVNQIRKEQGFCIYRLGL